jgi:hypothetical protein
MKKQPLKIKLLKEVYAWYERPHPPPKTYWDPIYKERRSNKDMDSMAFFAWMDAYIKETENYTDELWVLYPDRFGKKNREKYVFRHFHHNDMIYQFYYYDPDRYDRSKPMRIFYEESAGKYIYHVMGHVLLPRGALTPQMISDMVLDRETKEWLAGEAEREKERDEYYGRGPNGLF